MRSEKMENILVPLITFLFVIASSLMKRRSSRQDGIQPKPVVSDVDPNNGVPKKSAKSTKKVNVGIETNKQDQIERLKTSLNVNIKNQNYQINEQANEIERKIDQKKTIPSSEKVKTQKLALKKQLSITGLRQSIIMAEVLGLPRAKCPYSQSK